MTSMEVSEAYFNELIRVTKNHSYATIRPELNVIGYAILANGRLVAATYNNRMEFSLHEVYWEKGSDKVTLNTAPLGNHLWTIPNACYMTYRDVSYNIFSGITKKFGEPALFYSCSPVGIRHWDHRKISALMSSSRITMWIPQQHQTDGLLYV